jgi:hypothetical protein
MRLANLQQSSDDWYSFSNKNPDLFPGRGSSLRFCPVSRETSVMPEQRQQDDDGQRHAQQPEKCASAESHDGPPQSVCVVGVKTRTREPGSASHENAARRAAS